MIEQHDVMSIGMMNDPLKAHVIHMDSTDPMKMHTFLRKLRTKLNEQGNDERHVVLLADKHLGSKEVTLRLLYKAVALTGFEVVGVVGDLAKVWAQVMNVVEITGKPHGTMDMRAIAMRTEKLTKIKNNQSNNNNSIPKQAVAEVQTQALDKVERVDLENSSLSAEQTQVVAKPVVIDESLQHIVAKSLAHVASVEQQGRALFPLPQDVNPSQDTETSSVVHLDTMRQERMKLEQERQNREELARQNEQRRLEQEKEEQALQERLKAERLKAERLKAERLEAERLEAERLEAERLEVERLEVERLEVERLEAERLEAERLEVERLEQERLEAERLEAERLEAERLEAERLEAERLEAERLEAERLEAERIEQERLEAERVEALRLEEEKRMRAQEEMERMENERIEQARLELARAEAQRREEERLEQERVEEAEVLRLEQERLETTRLEQERIEREQLERERIEQERMEALRVEEEMERLAYEETIRLDQERMEQERLKEEEDRLALAELQGDRQRAEEISLASFLQSANKQNATKEPHVDIKDDGAPLVNTPMEQVAFEQAGKPSKMPEEKVRVVVVESIKPQRIQGRVRSGQVITHAGDVIIEGSVHAGGEIVASGDIHVYGNAGGRLLAGVTGDTHACIYVQHFDAEMICIAGKYHIFEDIDPSWVGKSIKISLDNHKLVFEAMEMPKMSRVA